MYHKFVCNEDTAVVETTKGKVRGYEYDGVQIFKGIPYAKAKRFHAPQPVEPWDGVMEVTSYSYVCPLLTMDKPLGELNVPHRFWVMNEDCQNLNVWTPACDEKKRPVMVWFHGGGYFAGSAIEHESYDGLNMSKLGDVVVVSVNHRLNVLGYFDLSAFGEEYENSGNAGTADLIMSLKWVQENIARFGGDPENVTIFGQSGGGGKVTTLLQSPEADGLYKQGMIMSGVVGPLLADCEGSGEDLGRALMEELQVNSISEMENVPYDELARAYNKLSPALKAAGKNVGGSPFPNAHYVGDPQRVGFRKETENVPLLVGSVFGEFAAFMSKTQRKAEMTNEEGKSKVAEFFGEETAKELLLLFEKAYPMRHPVDLLSMDFMFRVPQLGYVEKRSALNHCTYTYLFNEDTNLDFGRAPWHCFDIPYVFHNTQMVPTTQQEGVEELEQKIFDTVMAFARTGNPNNAGIPTWNPSTPEEEHTMFFAKEIKEYVNHDKVLLPLYARYMGPLFGRMMAEGNGQVQH